jgi:hypothetical protein
MNEQERLRRTGLTCFNPLEGHAVCKNLPKGSTCTYMYQNVGGIVLTRLPLFTNVTFLFLLFIKVAVLYCRPFILCLLNCITETIQVTECYKNFS